MGQHFAILVFGNNIECFTANDVILYRDTIDNVGVYDVARRNIDVRDNQGARKNSVLPNRCYAGEPEIDRKINGRAIHRVIVDFRHAGGIPACDIPGMRALNSMQKLVGYGHHYLAARIVSQGQGRRRDTINIQREFPIPLGGLIYGDMITIELVT